MGKQKSCASLEQQITRPVGGGEWQNRHGGGLYTRSSKY